MDIRIEWVSASNQDLHYFGIRISEMDTDEYVYGGQIYSPNPDFTLLAIF